ncbi:VOC family protein [Mycobacterium sp. Aquia_216]|uniref:VOC family protein n=1 Tax=Mycobacterium sp. Aquia_216 TaxID=2991729 RepID=UPI00227A204E|nr:VOC family protein [Mycobacterium sp. Aquia_216]WAJ44949.1 VOC family protein [Mycobacterium sp. Aquia_216]
MATLTWLGVPGDEHAWTTMGFAVDDRAIRIGRVRCALTDERGWGFDEIYARPEVLGVPTAVHPPVTGAVHPCGVTHVDHVVYAVSELDAAVTALNAVLGTPPRRRFHPRGPEGPEMAFYRAGEGFIEVVAAGAHPALIGLALWSPDLDATVAAIRAADGPIGDPKPAVQGGRIASVWQGHLNWGLAIMGP